MSSKLHLSNWKTYFFQFIDKYLKIEKVEYLIHYVKFRMWPDSLVDQSMLFTHLYLIQGGKIEAWFVSQARSIEYFGVESKAFLSANKFRKKSTHC